MFLHLADRWILLLLAMLTAVLVGQGEMSPAAATQQFRVTPHDVQILEGTDTLLRCEVSMRAGQVQWTKDGFALGFSAVIHGFPRYSVLVDSVLGIYNLQIKNVSLEDDAEYQCQVGPAPGNPAIRANAKINIVAAPTSINIENHARNAKVEVTEKQNLTLTCITENANPPAEIIWYRADAIMKNASTKVTTFETRPKRFRTTSVFTVQPSSEDDSAEISCEARHRALPPDVPMRSSVQLSVLYPPGMPFVEGYTQGDILRRGQKVELICRSIGGNPPAQLSWYKNGVAVASPQSTSGRLSENIYKFVAEPKDNGARVVCEARNILSTSALKYELKLDVHFAPKQVNVTGSTEAKAGDIVPLTCQSGPSNPSARINWSVNGRPLGNSTHYKSLASPDGGWLGISTMNLTIDAHSRSFVVVCHVLNMELTQNVVGSHTVHVLYPPSPPLITGYNDGDIITSGSIRKLLCSSAGGNPPPTLNWYKNDKKLNTVVKLVDNKISSELSILVNATDNHAIYKCEIQSSAIEIPLFATKTFSVHFPPETVKIKVQPKNLVPGIRAKLICDSSSSNPPAKVSWWKDGIPVDGVNLSNKQGLWGGSISSLEVDVNVTQDMHGIVYTCQSINDMLQRSVHESISLDILYPPKFESGQNTTYSGVEGEPLHIVVQAVGNPSAISYTWTRDGLPFSSSLTSGQRIVSADSILNITKLNRNDAGSYICEATNSQGMALMEIRVVVEYPATIVSVTKDHVFSSGEEAVLSCSVDGLPLVAEDITWIRDGYDFAERSTVTFMNGTSYLHIKDVQRSDMGNFTCRADNKRGTPTEQTILLVMQIVPELDHSSAFTRYAARLGERGKITCRARAAPEPHFVWRRNGKDIKMHRRNKFKAAEHKIDTLTFESVLILENTATEDYGQYECVVRNTLGQASSTLEFTKPLRPDTPTELRVANVSDDAVSLFWTPGFDGGLPVYYKLRYKLVNENKYKYEDTQVGASTIELDNLKPGSTYVFSIMAANEAGGSKYLPDIKLTLHKGAEPLSAEYLEKDEMPNLMVVGITTAAMILLILNAALVAWFVMRRQNKNSAEAERPNDDVYSKEESQSVYKLPITALQADVQKKSASTYLVENVDIIQSTAYPPKYQESSMCTPPYVHCNPDFTRTLPNPRRLSARVNGFETQCRSKDDHMLMANGLYIPSPSPASSLVIKGSYISSPSPAPPLDGAYFNMSDKYISYPPVAY